MTHSRPCGWLRYGHLVKSKSTVNVTCAFDLTVGDTTINIAGMLNNAPRTLAIVLVFTSCSATAAQLELRIKQSSAWNVDYADDRCRLMRQFGEGDEKVFVVFDRYGPGEWFRLTLAGKPLRISGETGQATIQFGPSEGEQKLAFYNGNLGQLPALVFKAQARLGPRSVAEQALLDNQKDGESIDIPPISPAREAAIQYLTVTKPLRRTVLLETGPMRRPFEALGKCVDDLMTSWGIDAEKHKNLKRWAKPVVPASTWMVANDYPVKMLSAGQPAIVEFRLSVDTDGKAVSCHIQSTTRPKEFDEAVCGSFMRRASFVPALDAQGQPIASFYQNTVRFTLEE